MKDGFLKVAAATPAIRVADCPYNAEKIRDLAREAADQGVEVVVFPELCLTGYTCGDLFREKSLLTGAEQALTWLLEQTAGLPLLLFVGVPVAVDADLYNCAAVLCEGRLLGLIPKQYLPNYSEFYEARHFTPGPAYREITLCGQTVPLGTDLLFACENEPELIIGCEICEDLWVAEPPSTRLAQAGAVLLCNLSASDETIGKAAYRQQLVAGQSGRLVAGYVYADAGKGESSTDLVFAGHDLIAENGTILAESELFETGLTVAHMDIQRLWQERRRMSTWRNEGWNTVKRIPFVLPQAEEGDWQRDIAPLPFVPQNGQDLSQRCRMILTMQAQGLAKRLAHTRGRSAVLGLSGGLDSTLALLVTAEAFDQLGLPREGILAVSMPCFGTTGRTKSNAAMLAERMHVSFKEIPIGEAVNVHFADIGHDPDVHDVTYENSQARERTQVLMDLANQTGGLVVGTGDLSELALGWATYNGDHMSMYAVNASIPKTLVRHLVRYVAVNTQDECLKETLFDILDTPVSPELLPPVDGKIAQKTEDLVGPYELHDFFLYYMLRFNFTPGKIYRMALHAFEGEYEETVIKKWLQTFYRRFFAQQFKRSCLPDGPKVGSVTLSPRGDWRMPSDASAALWLKEIETL